MKWVNLNAKPEYARMLKAGSEGLTHNGERFLEIRPYGVKGTEGENNCLCCYSNEFNLNARKCVIDMERNLITFIKGV
jgi:hypothetical protein